MAHIHKNTSGKLKLKPGPTALRCCSIPGAVKKVYHRSLPFSERWPPLRKGQFSAPAKFTAAITMLSQSLAPLDASSWTLGSASPTQKRCKNFGVVVVSILRADTKLLERCQALKQRSIAVMNFSLGLVWRFLCRTNARFRNANAIAMPA